MALTGLHLLLGRDEDLGPPRRAPRFARTGRWRLGRVPGRPWFS